MLSSQLAAQISRIGQPIDNSRRVVLAGNTRPEANAINDLGPVENNLHLDMFLQLSRGPEQEKSAREFVESLTNIQSPNFHNWIGAAEFGRRFGASAEDISTITGWLASQGFHVNAVPAHNMVIDFNGTAAQIRQTFRTEIHYFSVNGKRRFANVRDPEIPAALAPAVAGIVSMSDIGPNPTNLPKAQYTFNANYQFVVPADLATIYNLNPLFNAGYTGQGQTIVVVEDSDLFSGTADWNSFRKTLGLSQYSSATLTQSHPQGLSTCSDPGVGGAADEAAIDVEWASAAAPSAAIVMASCADTTNFGGFIALQNIVAGGGAVPSIVSISYGEGETQDGAAFNAYISSLYQLAAARGVSVFVSSGDAAATAVDRGNTAAVFGITVSGWASTPYNVAVGGTDFGDSAAGTTNSFWSPVNGTFYNSAKSYVPEIPWNNSCGSAVAANYFGFALSYGLGGFCNAYPDYNQTAAGSGGPSNCATGAVNNGYAASGSCAGWPKPAWQSVFGNPSDGVRDIPDVSLFAANGAWGHYYIVCFSLEASCSGAPVNWSGFGGTSVSSPIMAGIQALINQALGVNNVGNPNPVYYSIAQSQYSTANGRAACNSTTGPAANCAFNDVTQGDIVVPCAGSANCFTGSGQAEGVLSTSNTSFQPAYAAAPGWDFATGIGSVNAANLLTAFVNTVGSASGAPAAPVLVSPANSAASVSVAPTLTWNASHGATSYDVYLGTSNPPPMIANTNGVQFNAPALTPATAYYWAIGARNATGATVSAPFSFTTGCASVLAFNAATAPASSSSAAIPVSAPAGCAWTAASNASFITINSGASGSGNGQVIYSVSATAAAARTGTLTVAGQTFTVTQTGGALLISTLAGGTMPATPNYGSSLAIPVGYGLAADSAGNVYFPSPYLSAVFKKDPSGIVTRVAGIGTVGQEGIGGPALQAQLNFPESTALDSQGNLYIADSDNCRILMVNTSGTMSLVAGNASCGYQGDTGPAVLASLNFPTGIAVDSAGNVFISDTDNCVIRKVDIHGIINTIAGTGGACGYSGDGPAISARLYLPYGIALDTEGNLYIADEGNARIRMIAPSGNLTTIAGTGSTGYSGDGGPATGAKLSLPTGVAVDAAGDLYIADNNNARIRMVTASTGNISTVAGTGASGFNGDGGPGTSAALSSPYGVALDAAGNIYISDFSNLRIRAVNAAGVISTAVGGAPNDGGLAAQALLSHPTGVLRDSSGNTYVSDAADHRIRFINANGIIGTYAGNGTSGFSGDSGPAASAQLYGPQQLAMDSAGNLYIADSLNFRIRRVDTKGNITTYAGNGASGYSGDGGPAASAAIGAPYGVALDANGNLYLSDVAHNVVRKVDTSGNITTYAGNGSAGYAGDAGPATSAKLNYPASLAADASGNLYIADVNNQRVRIVSTNGTIATYAGNGNPGYNGDGGQAAKAEIYFPYGIAIDPSGNLYIADYENQRIRMVTSAGVISTIAGSAVYGYNGDGGLALAAAFRRPYAISADPQGNIAFADLYNNAIRLLIPESGRPVLTIQSTHTGNFFPGQLSATYTLTVTNGPGSATTFPVTASETVPFGLTLVQMSGPGWTCGAGGNTCSRTDVLAPGAAYPPITVTVNVAAYAPSQLVNQPSVCGGGGYPAASQDLTIVGAHP